MKKDEINATAAENEKERSKEKIDAEELEKVTGGRDDPRAFHRYLSMKRREEEKKRKEAMKPTDLGPGSGIE